MQRDRWQLVQDLYFRALEIPEEQRRPFLESACPNDLSIVQEIESLLKCEDKSGELLKPLPENILGALRGRDPDTGAADSDDRMDTGPDPVGSLVSHYRIL